MAYATVEQLAGALRVQVTAKNSELLDLSLEAAAAEIDHYLDRPVEEPLPEPAPALVVMGNVARGIEWFKANDAAFGAVGFADIGVLTAPADPFAAPCERADPAQDPVRDRVMGTLADLRERVAGVLVPLNADWIVHAGPVDAISPPAFVVVWPDPWLATTTACFYRARVQIICAAARLDPAPGYEQLEAMLAAALPALAGGGWPLEQVGGALPFECGGLHYQAARITVTENVTLVGST